MAIRKEDLHIGNLVVLAHESNAPIATIYEIRSNNCIVELLDTHKTKLVIPNDCLLPIDLSEYWLERLGDDCSDKKNGWQYCIRVGALNWYFRLSVVWYSELGGIYMDSRIKHIHQIQNIHLDFTGNHITLKEPINE